MVVSKTATIESINPATRQAVGEVPIMGSHEVKDAVERAWKAYETWQLVPYHKRIKKIIEFRRLLEAGADEIAQLITTEVGKPIVESYFAEMTGPLDSCVWLADNIETMLKDQVVQMTNPLLATKQSVITFEPLGAIGIIAPWNYPFSIPVMTILMAVACGNTVILKPSEKSPMIGIKIGELFEKAGFPAGVVQVITGDRSTGEHLTKCDLARIIFTGSASAGCKIMQQAAPNLTPLSLELGGKDAAIVLPDAPVDWTARGLVWGAFTNAGQACASIERVYIIKGKNTQKLIDKIVQYTSALQVGLPTDQTTDVGPVIDESQLATVEAHVTQARELGAEILTGGKRHDDLAGYFYMPTVLTNVNHTMDIMTKETFGPVMPIMIVDTEDEAVARANDSDYGLCASVWAGGLSRAEAVARDLQVGTVLINDCLVSHAMPQVPWGGLKKSGFGRSHSHFGLMDLINIKHISMDSSGGARRIWWYPYGPSRVKTARGGLKFLHGTFPLGKIKGLCIFVWNMFRKAK
ncbi:MAG TPA: aldehyde dehydrogenase family protein [Drouetiella sp.]|jgi:acyl-CoA reductase-like NAD-dependent aldehyde dehydrogenase